MTLSDSVTTLPKIGPSVAKKLEKLGITTLYDLIYHFPFRYEDSSQAIKISDLVNHPNEIVTVKAKVFAIEPFRTKFGKYLVQGKIYDESGMIDVIWFNQKYIVNYLKKGTEAIFYGKLNVKGKRVNLSGPKYEVLDEGNSRFLGKISSIYPETSGVTSRWLNSKIALIIEQLSYLIELQDKIYIRDTLPKEVIHKYNLLDLITALKQIHFPTSYEEIDKARERLAFDEIYQIQKGVLEAKKLRQKLKTIPIAKDENLLNTFIQNSAFAPTGAQIRSVNEIVNDMQNLSPMNRLLEGDVGSGKTWVAAASALQVLNEGYDVAFLAPTSVLASQHSESLIKMIEDYGVKVELITSGTRKKRTYEKQIGDSGIFEESIPQIYQHIKGNLYVGTHALLYEPDVLKNLGLVIVDEQHRFGVKQREYLLDLESENVKEGIKTTPHFLSMTATPIPRSMALTVFGDIELSVLDELPKGRIKIDTFLVNEEKRDSCYTWAKNELDHENMFGEKNQMFVICPLIEESENLMAKSALSEYERIKEEFSEFKVELLHGKMKEKEKSLILDRFGKKEFDILVATPVIEVGIDIKDATIIMIESAERFGLAQLHQLRGRVGRSSKKSYCVLFTSDGEFPDRLKYFAQTDLGIKLAEYDLERRGPGEVYGTKQSGIPKLKVANIMDVDLVKKVRDAILENSL